MFSFCRSRGWWIGATCRANSFFLILESRGLLDLIVGRWSHRWKHRCSVWRGFVSLMKRSSFEKAIMEHVAGFTKWKPLLFETRFNQDWCAERLYLALTHWVSRYVCKFLQRISAFCNKLLKGFNCENDTIIQISECTWRLEKQWVYPLVKCAD